MAMENVIRETSNTVLIFFIISSILKRFDISRICDASAHILDLLIQKSKYCILILAVCFCKTTALVLLCLLENKICMKQITDNVEIDKIFRDTFTEFNGTGRIL